MFIKTKIKIAKIKMYFRKEDKKISPFIEEVNKLAVATIIFEFIFGIGFYGLVHYGVYPFEPEVIVIEVVSASVGDVVPAATQDTTNLDEEKVSEETTPPSVGSIVDKIHILESSAGKNNFSKCKAQGLYNEFGYGVYGDNFLCFERGEDRKAVEKWFIRELSNLTIQEAVCKYNTGKTDNCPYFQKFQSL